MESTESTSIIITLLLVIGSYLLGSLSSAIIICKLFHLPDPRTEGSKNPGATNVLRLGGKIPAICTLLGDFLKGYLAVLIAMQIHPTPWTIGPVMVAVFLGHLYPIFFNFIGGKGVATAFGVLLALNWKMGLCLFAIWLVIAFLFKISSLAALTVAAMSPILTYFFLGPAYIPPVLIIALFLFWRHRKNISRLLAGTEPKIGKK